MYKHSVKLFSHFLFALLISSQVNAYTDLYRLVWTDDPSSTMTIGWRQGSGSFTEVKYRVKGSLAIWQSNTSLTQYNYQNTVNGTSDVLNNSFVTLTGLSANTDYEFTICDSDGCSDRYMWFRTSPNTAQTVTFVAGGDSRRDTSTNYAKNDQARTDGFKLVSKLRPTFVLFSGDFMNDGTFEEWLIWLDEWQLTQSSDGRMYPIVPTHGNHENDALDMVQQVFNVQGVVGNSAYGTYNALSFGGDLLRIWTLNTELEPGIGYSAFQNQNSTAWNEQATWLGNDLAANSNVQWKIANYHRPLRPHTSGKSEGNLRYSAWAPLFDTHDVDLAIESDSHMVKYTAPVNASSGAGSDEGFIEADHANSEHGTVFIGEGSWGAPKRPIDDDKDWTIISNSFWQFKHITVSPSNLEVRTVRFENSSYPNGVDVDVAALTQLEQDNDPAALPTGLDLWLPFEGDIPLTLPYSDTYTVKADANEVPVDDNNDPQAPENALFFTNFTGAVVDGATGSIATSYGDITQFSQACTDAPWYIYSGSSGSKASANGYAPGSTPENCSNWLFLPPQDLSGTDAITLTFDSDYNFNGPDLELVYSSDYDPSVNADPASATWTTLSWDIPSTGGYTVESSGPVVIFAADIPLAEQANVTIAYHYTSNGREAGDGKIWEVDNIAIVDGEQVGEGDTETIMFFTDFTGAVADGVTGSIATSYGDITQYTETCSDESWYIYQSSKVSANTYSPGATPENCSLWLFVPAQDLSALDAMTLTFDSDYNFDGPELELVYSSDYDPQVNADPSTANWTTLNWTKPATGGYTVAPSGPVVIQATDVPVAERGNVTIAYHYTSNGREAGDGRIWEVDNIKIIEGEEAPAPVVDDTVPAKPTGTLRVASFNVLLANRGAGSEPSDVYDPSIDPDALKDDLVGGNDSQAQGVAEIIQRINPDIILLNEFDWDATDVAVNSFRTEYLEVAQAADTTAVTYPYYYVAISNTGVQPESEGEADCDFNDSGVGCGVAGSANDNPEDAYGFGYYPGAFGMVMLSKYPIDSANVRTFRKFLWKDMPANVIPAGWYASDELDIFRVSSKSHWDIPVNVNGETVHILGSHPTPPVFDGTEDRNGRRNHDEIRLWENYVSETGSNCFLYDDDNTAGCLGYGKRFVVVGDQNADPSNGDSFGSAILQLLNNPFIDGSFTQIASGGEGRTSGLAATADFGLRADYVVPGKAGLNIRMDSCDSADPGLSCGIYWPRVGDPKRDLTGSCSDSGPSCASSDHRLVWLDLEIVADQDNDEIPDDIDNCLAISNNDQQDLDKDGLGTVCDTDDDNDQMDDAWEALYGFSSADPSDALLDTDGDGVINRDEFLNDTNPLVNDEAEVPLLPVLAQWLLGLSLILVARRYLRKIVSNVL